MKKTQRKFTTGILAMTLACVSTLTAAQGMGDIKSGEMGYRAACSIHELADTGFHCQEYQETHDLINQQTPGRYWPDDYGFDNQFMPSELNSSSGGGGGSFRNHHLSPRAFDYDFTD